MSNSPVIAFLNKMTDLIVLNILFLICCLPIITIGDAITAMYYVCIISIREGDGYVWKRFIKSFRMNFKQATILWIPIILIGTLLIFDLFYWYTMGTVFAKIMFVFSAIIAFMLFIVILYIFPVLAKCKGTLLEIIKNATAFAYGYLPYTTILIVITAIFVGLNITSVGVNAITFFIGFALVAYIKSFFIYKVMMKHMDENYGDFDLDKLSESGK